MYSETVLSLHAAGHIADELGSTVAFAQMWMIRGQPRMARRLYERALRTAQQDPGAASTVLGDLHVGLSEVLLEQRDLEAAAHHLQTSKELGEGASFLENRHRWYVAMAGLRVPRGTTRPRSNCWTRPSRGTWAASSPTCARSPR